MIEPRKTTCAICKLEYEQALVREFDYGERVTINCPRCKLFTITRTAESIARHRELSPKLSSWIRNLNELGTKVPEINSKLLEELPPRIPDYSPREKQIILLQNIERKTEYPGKPVKIDPEFDIPLAWASAPEEFMYYIDSLIERGLLRKLGKEGVPFQQGATGELIYDRPFAFSVAITADGWDYLEQYDRRIEERTQAFVAMSFSEDMKSIWKGPIFNAITKAGYKPYRVDAEPHINLIDVQIISAIKDSRFVVADFTHQNLGVYFETGYAQGMGLPVIRCVKEDDFENLHFDKNHYNFIKWKTPDDLENQLYNFICAIIGKGKGT